MSIKITLEIGHEAAIRTKRTPEGFTHDWEVFIRGCDNANIQYYIEKVIFHLHETFQKPKRVVKEPPYSVKESGYAGFTLPIEIHLRNKDEPKKITFNYDLTLQPNGPAICKLQKEKFVFNNPSEEFRHKLLKGGGMIVNSSTASDDINHEKLPHSDDKIQLVSKPKLSIGEIPRKHKLKIEEPRNFNSFQDLFGTPITKTTTKVFSEPKTNTNNSSRDDYNKLSISKHEKDKEKIKKHSSHKSKDKDKVKEKSKIESEKKIKTEKNREDKKEKRDKDEKNREKKEKKEKSPRPRSSSPKHVSPKTPPSPILKQEERKGNPLKEKERKLEKSEQKLQAIESSNKKKEKYDNEKRNKEKSFIKSSDSKENKANNKEKDKGEIKKEKDVFAPPHGKIEKKNKEVIKEPKTPAIEPEDLINKKDKSERNDEKKHKHKKKDKDKKDKEKKKESKSKSHKSEEQTVNTNSSEKNFENRETLQVEDERSRKLKNEYSAPKFTEKSPEIKQEVNSDSSVSSPVSVHEEILLPPPPPPPPEPIKEEPDFKPETLTKHKKEKKEKKSKGDKENKKLKRKSEVKIENEPVEKIKKDETKEKQEDKEEIKHNNKEPEVKGDVAAAAAVVKNEVKTDEEPAPQEEEDAGENDENREAYMNRLKDLQQRIMTLEDNDELQKVVELIAKTGKYEVSARTFDFDLCLLERSTIRKLQEFFDI